MDKNIHDFARDAQSLAGLLIDHPIPDGEIHRVFVTGDKRGSKNGWYVLYENRQALKATFGTWKTGEVIEWTNSEYKAMNEGERREVVSFIANMKRQKEAEKKQAARAAQAKAETMISQSKSAEHSHPYLVKKAIPGAHLLQQGKHLLVPLRDTEGNIHTLQTIDPEGNKRFLSGGAIQGHFWLCGADTLPREGRLYVCEGVATALSIWGTTHCPVAAAMNAGNLEAVALNIRYFMPELQVIIAADSDHHLEHNIGLEKAMKAAKKAMCSYIKPPLPCKLADCKCTDFNDAFNCKEAG